MKTRSHSTGVSGPSVGPSIHPSALNRAPAFRLALAVFALALFLAALEACDPGGVAEPEAALEVVPDSVTLTHLGQRFAFSVRGGGADAVRLQWISRDTTVFHVDANGSVTARGNGAAQVVARTPMSADGALVRVRQAAAALEVTGDAQRAAVGFALLDPVGVRVLDAGGSPASGVVVRFEADAGNGRVKPAAVLSDGEGMATAEWTLGPEPGRQTLTVSVEGTAKATIAATALGLDEAVASFEVRSGGDQWAWRGRALAEPVAVRALDKGGRAVAGATVRFEPGAGSGRVNPSTAVTDSAGVASTQWTLGADAELQTLSVSAGGDASLAVTATARDPDEAASAVEAHSGEDQWAVAGHALPDPVSVRIVDEDGQPVWGAMVRFEPEAGIGNAEPGTTATDSLGLASAVWTLGLELGVQRLGVTAGGATVAFDGTAVSTEGVCNRTPAVSAEIARRARVGSCAELTREMLQGISILRLSGKGIRRLRSGDFEGLSQLQVLNLSENQLAELPPTVFLGLERLHRLDLSFNQLAELPPDIFAGTPALGNLYLRRNALRTLPPLAFANLESLSILIVDYNELAELPEDVFQGLSELTNLVLNGNPLRSLPAGIFGGLSRLQEVWLGATRLTALPERLFAESPALRFIQLRHNRLTELPPNLFSETRALQRLYLQGNRLQTLPPTIFDGLTDLVRLDLNGNDLTELPPGIFDGTPRLAQLSVNWNQLEDLPRGLFAGLSELEWVTFKGNPGADFGVRPEFVRMDADDALAVGPARVVVQVPLGAPLAFDMPVSVQGGRASHDLVSFEPGDTVSDPVTVSGAGPVHVGFGVPPRVTAEGYTGLEVVRGEELVLFKESDNGSPAARSSIPAHRLQDEGPSAEVPLADYFHDPNGDSLAYSVATTEPGVVHARVEGGTLKLDPVSVDTTEVEVTATDPGGLRATHRFRAWVVPAPDPNAFNIELYFEPGFTGEEEATIRRAAARWMEVVTGDLPDVPVDGFQERLTDSRLPHLVGVVDDLLIRMTLSAVHAGSAASAGVSGKREGSALAFYGGAAYNLWYVRNRSLDELYRVALHEIGHVLGIGGWFDTDLFRDEETDPHFAGPLAVAAFDAAGGGAYSGGKVPLEDRVPTLHVHWRQRVIPGDIMSIGSDSKLLTAITVQALADLGYEVDVSKADPYSLPMATHADIRGGVGETEEAGVLADDMVAGPVVVVDGDGKVVRVIRP